MLSFLNKVLEICNNNNSFYHKKMKEIHKKIYQMILQIEILRKMLKMIIVVLKFQNKVLKDNQEHNNKMIN